MQKIEIQLAGFAVTIEGETATDLFPAAAFWLSLPATCPLCGRTVVLEYTTPKTFKYYKLKCTGSPAHAVNLGQKQIDQSLYYDARKPWEVFQPGSDHGDAGPTTPVQALPAGETRAEFERDRLGQTGTDTAALAAAKNELIQLIMSAKKSGIRTGLVPADVAAMSNEMIVAAAGRVREILSKGK